ncbi:hypothetical protein RI367_004904 [Sorochytrium milnesiophthora]
MSSADPLKTSASTRLKKHDVLMFFALWLEYSPYAKSPSPDVHPTGAVIVDANGRLLSLDYSKEAHAIPRAIIRCAVDPRGADVYVSRFPSTLCSKFMVQAGIRRCFYFPAALFTPPPPPPTGDNANKDSSDEEYKALAAEYETRKKAAYQSVQRLVQNSSISLSIYIPEWVREQQRHVPRAPVSECEFSDDGESNVSRPSAVWEALPETDKRLPSLLNDRSLTYIDDSHIPWYWAIDECHFGGGEWERMRDGVFQNLKETLCAFHAVVERYCNRELKWGKADVEAPEMTQEEVWEAEHAMVLAHIASRRTDDPKVGVGAVLVQDRTYMTVGWNGFPKKSQRHDYPRLGADEARETDELKYAYVLHAEQNALLFRCNPALPISKHARFYSTKYPCDECAPVISDAGIANIFTIPPSRRNRTAVSEAAGNQPVLAVALGFTQPPSPPASNHHGHSNNSHRASRNSSSSSSSLRTEKHALSDAKDGDHEAEDNITPNQSASTPSTPKRQKTEHTKVAAPVLPSSATASPRKTIGSGYRGLTYNKLEQLADTIWLFQLPLAPSQPHIRSHSLSPTASSTTSPVLGSNGR